MGTRAGARPGLVVIGRECFGGREFESQHRILDGYFSHIGKAHLIKVN